jgi:hypothetical protein
MTPTEFWHLYQAKKPRKMYGRLTETDVADLEALLDRALEDHANGTAPAAS